MTQIMQNTRYSETYAYVRAMQEKKNVGWGWGGGMWGLKLQSHHHK